MVNIVYINILPFLGDKEVVYQLENGKRYMWKDDSTTYVELDLMSYELPLSDI